MPNLIVTQRLYRLDEPITVASTSNASQYRFVGKRIRVTWRPDEPMTVELSMPDHQVHIGDDWKSMGGMGGYVPVPVGQHPEWLDESDA